MTRDRRVRFASAFEWELLDARDSVNHGISIASRPNQKLVMWERKSAIEREADRFLRRNGVRGLRIANERRHDTTRGASVLSDSDRAEIVVAHRSGETQTALGKRYGVSRRLVFNVLRGDREAGSST